MGVLLILWAWSTHSSVASYLDCANMGTAFAVTIRYCNMFCVSKLNVHAVVCGIVCSQPERNVHHDQVCSEGNEEERLRKDPSVCIHCWEGGE